MLAMAFTCTLVSLLMMSKRSLNNISFTMFSTFMDTFWGTVQTLLGSLRLLGDGSQNVLFDVAAVLTMTNQVKRLIETLLTMTGHAVSIVTHPALKYLDPVFQAHQLRNLDGDGVIAKWASGSNLQRWRAALSRRRREWIRATGVRGGAGTRAGEEGHGEERTGGTGRGEEGAGRGGGAGDGGDGEGDGTGDAGDAGGDTRFAPALAAARALSGASRSTSGDGRRPPVAPRASNARGAARKTRSREGVRATPTDCLVSPRPAVANTGGGSTNALLRERKSDLLATCRLVTGQSCPLHETKAELVRRIETSRARLRVSGTR